MSFVCLLMHCYCFVARNNSPESEIWAAHFHCEMPLICGITGWDVYSSQKWLINKRTLSIALLWLVLKQNRKKKLRRKRTLIKPVKCVCTQIEGLIIDNSLFISKSFIWFYFKSQCARIHSIFSVQLFLKPLILVFARAKLEINSECLLPFCYQIGPQILWMITSCYSSAKFSTCILGLLT